MEPKLEKIHLQLCLRVCARHNHVILCASFNAFLFIT